MKTYSNQQIVDYYDTTEIHYERGWDLRHSLAMHYGYWDEKAKDFRSSLERMNEVMAQFAGIQATDKVLDAGCGVGGSCIFLARELGCQVTGISLSQQQVEKARKNATAKGVNHLTQFQQADFRCTPFEEASYDVIWALESAVHDPVKHEFLKEAYRLLKPGGRLIIGEYFKLPKKMRKKEEQILRKWLNAWAISDINSLDSLREVAEVQGFKNSKVKNITPNIRKSSWRMFYGSLFLTVLSALYRLYNPKVSHFADNHYKGLLYQYPALRRKLWQYYFICLVK